MKFADGRAVTVALSLVLAAGCGGGGGSSTDGPPRASTGSVSTGKSVTPGFDLNACLRRRGMTIVAPGQRRPKDETSAKLRAALSACVKEQKKSRR